MLHPARAIEPRPLRPDRDSCVPPSSTLKMVSKDHAPVNGKHDVFCRIWKFSLKLGPSLPKLLPKKVPFGLHEQVLAGTVALFVRVVAHDGDGDAQRLAHYEFGGGGKFVCYRQEAGGQRVAV